MSQNPMTRALSGRTLRLLLMLLALVEVYFIADNLATLIEVVVGNGGTVLDSAFLLLLTMPLVIDFALPLIILLALFFAISAARDDNELVACAAAGVPWTSIPRFAFGVGLLGCLVSILFSGFLSPMSKYTSRLAVHTMEVREVLKQIEAPSPANTLRKVKNRTVIATPPTSDASARGNLFIFDPDRGSGWRVSQASDWSIEGPDENRGYSIQLKKFRDYRESHSSPATQNGLSEGFGQARINVQSVAIDFRLQEVLPGFDPTLRTGERAIFSLAVLGGATKTQLVDRHLGEVLARGILCIFAALAAVAAATWAGNKRSRIIVLPMGAIAVLAADVAARTILGDVAALGGPFWPTAAGLFLCAIVIPTVFIWRGAELIIAPGRAQG